MRLKSVFISIIAILLCSAFETGSVSAQEFTPTPVAVSTEKVNIKGTILYVHKVLKGQTLYSVSKAYNVPIDVIIKQNPTLKEGLKTGSLIYIPTSSAAQQPKPENEEPSVKQSENAPYQQTNNANTKKYKKHVVKWYETISDISAKYSVSAEAIIDLNRLPENPVLTKKQVLLIPDKNYVISKKKEEAPVKETDPKAAFPGTPVQTQPQTQIQTHSETEPESGDLSSSLLYEYSASRTYKISLVLPFGTKNGTDKANVNQMDFYSGALMALKDFQNETGLRHFHLNVVDLSDYPSTSALINSRVLEGSEIIIGPVFEKNMKEMAQYALSERIPIVSPMDPKTEYIAKENPFFFQFPTPAAVVQNTLTDKIAQRAENDSSRTHLYFEKGTGNSPLVQSSIRELSEKGVIFDTLSYGILEGRGIDTVMLMQMDTVHLNKVLIASESEAFVSDILRNLHLLQSVDTINLEVYGQSRWRNFEIIELEYLHLLNTHLSLPYYIDYNSAKVKEFVSSYWKNFKAEPTPFAFQGYDVVTYFLSALSEYGREFPMHIQNYRKDLLQSHINMVRTSPDGGFENQAAINIVYQKGWLINPWR